MTEPDSAPSWGDAVREGRWADFAGLPAELDERGLLEALDRTRRPPSRKSVPLSHQTRTLVEDEGLRYWLDEDDSVVLAEIENPTTATPVDQLLEALGTPDRQGAGRYRRFGAMTTEYVYPGRGLALTIAESYDDPPTFEPSVAAVQLFSPSDLQRFLVELGGADRGGPKF